MHSYDTIVIYFTYTNFIHIIDDNKEDIKYYVNNHVWP